VTFILSLAQFPIITALLMTSCYTRWRSNSVWIVFEDSGRTAL